MKMTRRAFLGMALVAGATLAGCALPQSITPGASENRELYRATPLNPEDLDSTTVARSEDEWRSLLAPLQFHVMREKGTERAYTGEYHDYKGEGIYHCSACGNPLFASDTKYDSGTGWPSYWAPISDGYIRTERDISHGMVRTEVLCARCGSHLGHVFDDGPQPTGLRYCMNSVALNFVPSDGGEMMPESQDTTNNKGEVLKDTTESVTGDLLLFDFDSEETIGRWAVVNDGVMGGLSQSNMLLTDRGTALFVGKLSLENYGGFASVRTIPNSFELGGYEGLVLRVRGDGRRYKLRLRIDRNLDGPAYEADFDTVTDRWVTVRIPFADMRPTFRGRQLRNMPLLDGKSVAQIGLMIADKKSGDFSLEVDWIRAYRLTV